MMLFAFFNEEGRIDTAINDDTVTELPVGSKQLTPEQWDKRFDLLLVDDDLTLSPLPAPGPAPKTQFTPLEFLELFSENEQLAVVGATRTTDAIKLWYDKMLASTFVDLDDPRTTEGLNALVAFELITQARVDEIMGVPQE